MSDFIESNVHDLPKNEEKPAGTKPSRFGELLIFLGIGIILGGVLCGALFWKVKPLAFAVSTKQIIITDPATNGISIRLEGKNNIVVDIVDNNKEDRNWTYLGGDTIILKKSSSSHSNWAYICE